MNELVKTVKTHPIATVAVVAGVLYSMGRKHEEILQATGHVPGHGIPSLGNLIKPPASQSGG